MQLGVNSVLFGGHDLRTAFQHIKWAGYDGIEISALDGFGAFGDPLGEHLHLATWHDDAAMIRELREEFELPITAMEVGPLDEERIRLAFEAAVATGIPIINVGPSGKSGSAEDLDACIARLTTLATEAESAGLCLCVKAHIGASIYNTTTTLQAMAAIDSPGFGIDMDPSHIYRGGEEPRRRSTGDPVCGTSTFVIPGRVRHRGQQRSERAVVARSISSATAGSWSLAGYRGRNQSGDRGASQYPVSRNAMIAAGEHRTPKTPWWRRCNWGSLTPVRRGSAGSSARTSPQLARRHWHPRQKRRTDGLALNPAGARMLPAMPVGASALAPSSGAGLLPGACSAPHRRSRDRCDGVQHVGLAFPVFLKDLFASLAH